MTGDATSRSARLSSPAGAHPAYPSGIPWLPGTTGAARRTGRTLRGLVTIEAAVIGAVSWLLAVVVLAVPTTLAFGNLFGNLLLDTPLAFTVNAWTTGGWLPLVVVICALASLGAARRASRMTVGDALAYE